MVLRARGPDFPIAPGSRGRPQPQPLLSWEEPVMEEGRRRAAVGRSGGRAGHRQGRGGGHHPGARRHRRGPTAARDPGLRNHPPGLAGAGRLAAPLGVAKAGMEATGDYCSNRKGWIASCITPGRSRRCRAGRKPAGPTRSGSPRSPSVARWPLALCRLSRSAGSAPTPVTAVTSPRPAPLRAAGRESCSKTGT